MYKNFENVLNSPHSALSRTLSLSGDEGLHRPWCHKILSTDCASWPSMTGARGANFFGRSMIEMLGVLAIIGVLSVGGIAGYSKAMEKFKINKVIEQYSMMTYGILEHLDDFKKSQIVTIDTLQALNILPQSWIHNTDVIDDFNNKINLYIRKYGARNDFIIDIYLSGVSPNANNGIFYQNFSKRICVELFQNLFLPLHTNAVHAEVYRSSGNYYSFAGDSFCTSANAGPTKCMTDVTLDDIHKACDSCDKTDESCNVNIHF